MSESDVPPVWRRPALAPLSAFGIALGVAFVLVWLLGTFLPTSGSASQTETGGSSSAKPPLIRVTVESPMAGLQPSQVFRIQIMAKGANLDDGSFKEWPLPIPSTTLVQEKLMDQGVCLNGPPGWQVKESSIPMDEIRKDGRRCTKTVLDQPGEISFTVSTS